MNGYFKCYAESHDGDEGDYVCEVQDDEIVRQIFLFKNALFWATRRASFDERYDFTDQPESSESDGTWTPLTREEFEALWSQALAQHPGTHQG